MTDELKPIPCGCGGSPIIRNERGKAVYVQCVSCGTRSIETNRAEAIEAWNKAMGTNTRRLLEVLVHDATDTNVGNKERKKGKWIFHIDDLFPEESTQECSVCREEESIRIHNDNFCPNCGADMRGE